MMTRQLKPLFSWIEKDIGFSHRPFLGAVVSERLPPKLLGMTDKKFKEVAVTVAFIVVASLTSLFCKRDKKREKQYRNNCCLRQSYETESLGKLSSTSVSRQTDNKKVEKIAELGIWIDFLKKFEAATFVAEIGLVVWSW